MGVMARTSQKHKEVYESSYISKSRSFEDTHFNETSYKKTEIRIVCKETTTEISSV